MHPVDLSRDLMDWRVFKRLSLCAVISPDPPVGIHHSANAKLPGLMGTQDERYHPTKMQTVLLCFPIYEWPASNQCDHHFTFEEDNPSDSVCFDIAASHLPSLDIYPISTISNLYKVKRCSNTAGNTYFVFKGLKIFAVKF